MIDNIELSTLIDLAGDFLGTDKELRSIACIEVALKHAETLREELAMLRAELPRVQS